MLLNAVGAGAVYDGDLLLMLKQHPDNTRLGHKGMHARKNLPVALAMQHACLKAGTVVVVDRLDPLPHGRVTRRSGIDRKIAALGVTA